MNNPNDINDSDDSESDEDFSVENALQEVEGLSEEESEGEDEVPEYIDIKEGLNGDEHFSEDVTESECEEIETVNRIDIKKILNEKLIQLIEKSKKKGLHIQFKIDKEAKKEIEKEIDEDINIDTDTDEETDTETETESEDDDPNQTWNIFLNDLRQPAPIAEQTSNGSKPKKTIAAKSEKTSKKNDTTHNEIPAEETQEPNGNNEKKASTDNSVRVMLKRRALRDKIKDIIESKKKKKQ